MIKEVRFKIQLFAVLIFIFWIFYGLFFRTLVLKTSPLEIETIMVLISFSIVPIILIGTNIKFPIILDNILKTISCALPGLLLLLLIGMVIGSFILSGLVPMLIYYGINLINPTYIYLIGFILTLLFSTLTGSSWGSIATMGVVVMGVGNAAQANIPLLCGALISGAYFGDKMSPLSDTTNMAAIAAQVDLYDHIYSMLYTTIPAAIISCIIYLSAGLLYSPVMTAQSINDSQLLQTDISNMFNFSIILIIPLLVVLIGSIKRVNAFIVMSLATISALFISFIIQDYSLDNIFTVMNSGFDISMATWHTTLSLQTPIIMNRGGFWELGSLLPVGISILCVVGIMSSINAMSSVVGMIFNFANTRTSIVISSLLSGAILISTTSNGIATSFVNSDIFKSKYDKYNISRSVLSRCNEDTGTMLEVLLPWTPAAIFFSQTLGVSTLEYAPYAIMNWVTPLVGVTLAIINKGIFINKKL